MGIFPQRFGSSHGVCQKKRETYPQLWHLFLENDNSGHEICHVFFLGGPILRQIYIDKIAHFFAIPIHIKNHNMNVSINFVLLPCLGFGG